MTQKATAEVCELMEACLRRTLGLGTRLACAELAKGLAGDCIRIACKLAYRTNAQRTLERSFGNCNLPQGPHGF